MGRYLTQTAGQCRRYGNQDGFTLVEVLTALGVLGVATFIAVRLFTASHDLAQTNNHQVIAEQLAHGLVTQVLANPDGFDWPDLNGLEPGGFAPIESKRPPVQFIAPPSVTPTLTNVAQAERRLYERFTWTAYASESAVNDKVIDVTAVIRWRTNMKPQAYTFTSAIPVAEIPTGGPGNE